MLKFQHFEILFFSILRAKNFPDQNVLEKSSDVFDRAKVYFFSELRYFFGGYSPDVKISGLFIFYAFRFIRTRQTCFLDW